MELIFLGTGAGMPSKSRNVSSMALWLERLGAFWLFDCGEATQHQIQHTKVKLGKIEKIFVTHLHGDHLFGLPGLLGSRSFQGSGKPLAIYGPPGIRDFVEVSLAVSRTHLTYELAIFEIAEGLVLDEKGFKVTCQKLDHGVDSYGYRVEEPDFSGALLVEKLRKTGVPAGPLYARLKSGEDVLWEGKTLCSRDFVSEPKPGKVVAILGDTRYAQASVELAWEADLLVHEASFSEADSQLAQEYFHSTAREAALVAKHAGVKQLVLTHISARYLDESVLLSEARAVHLNTMIARDLGMVSTGKDKFFDGIPL